MSTPTLTRRYNVSRDVADRDQEVPTAIIVQQLLKNNWSKPELRVRFGGRDKWWDGSESNQIFVKPVTLGISKSNVITLGANLHRRNPVYGIHIFSRSADAIDQLTDEVDDIIKDRGVNPERGIQYILPATIPSTVADEIKDDGSTLFHNIVFVEILFYKNRV